MGRLKKYYFREPLKNISKETIDRYLERQVFGTAEFKLHVKRVAFNLKIDEVIVRDVLVSYFTNIMYLINTIRKIKTKINVYCYFSILIEKGNRF